MKTYLHIVIGVMTALMTIMNASASEPPHTKLTGVWAYGDEVTDSVNLDYRQNNLRFFCGTEENLPIDSVAYRFRLKGYDNDWIVPFREGWFFYTNLAPGHYEFMAQSRRHGGEWGDPLIYSFTIATPWWRTWWAWSIYGLAACAIVIYIFYLVRSRLIMHNQLIVERENQRFRNEFVMHAAREFKTPLTIIRTTVEKLKGTRDDRLTRTEVQHLRNSSKMLMLMVEDLIEFRDKSEKRAYRDKDDVLEMADIPINKDTTVLIVEPDTNLADVMMRDMVRFMKVNVSGGDDFMDAVNATRPDAVVLDTDTRDAYSLLHEFKKSHDRASVPVILISDFNSSRAILRAIRSEADDYLPKPFNCEVLTALVMKKIKFQRTIASENNDSRPAATSPLFEKRSDKLFTERLDRIMEENIANQEFDINTLAKALGISRGQLYNKVKSLHGMSPVEYLRDMRLAKAASLLKGSRISVKEARCMAGMPDATYFNRRFKEKYGISPSEYR